MTDRAVRILLALTVLFVATGAALALHCHEEGHELGAADCQVCHWLLAAAAGLILAAFGIWLHETTSRRAHRTIRVMPRSCGRPRSAASRAPPFH